MPDDPDRPESVLFRVLRERGHRLRDPALFERARAAALAAETGYDFETAFAVLRGMPPPRPRPTGFAEKVRLGTLERMRRALAETEDRLSRLRDDGRPPDDQQVREAEAWRAALIRDLAEMDRERAAAVLGPAGNVP